MPHDNAFADAEALTLEDMIIRVRAEETLSKQRRQNLVSSIRTFCRCVDRSPDQVLAHASFLRRLLKKLHPAQCGLTKSRLTNIRSDLNHLIKNFAQAGGRTYMAPFTPAWQRLWDEVVPDSSRYELRSVSRLMHLCSAMALSPNEVDDQIGNELLKALHQDITVKKPLDRWKKILRAWNKLVDQVPEWPQCKLSIPKSERCYTIPLEQFPEAFQAEVNVAFKRWSCVDILDEFAPNKPFAPATLQKRRVQIRSMASALVLIGRKRVEEVTSLSQLVEIESATAILRFFLARNNGKTNSHIHQLAIMIVVLAKHDVGVDERHLKELQHLRGKLDPGSLGMTEKNRDRLRPFDDPKNVSLLLRLPRSVVRQVQRDDQGLRREAIAVQLALAVEILLMASMRLKNLVNLDIERHIVRTRASNGEVHLVIPGDEVKNGEPLDYTLPAETVELLDLYLSDYRPRLCRAGNPWLFPGKANDAPKSGHTLSTQISSFVRRHTGLEINVHLFRHIAAKLYLDQNPGHYENVRRHLGHRDIKTTTNAYAGMETAAASKHFDQTILKLRHAASPEVPTYG